MNMNNIRNHDNSEKYNENPSRNPKNSEELIKKINDMKFKFKNFMENNNKF